MAEAWTKGEYRITNGIYETALAHRREGRRMPRQDIVARCKRDTGRRADGPMLTHLGMLTAARKALGLATLPDFAPLAYYPRKLVSYLKAREAPPPPGEQAGADLAQPRATWRAGEAA